VKYIEFIRSSYSFHSYINQSPKKTSLLWKLVARRQPLLTYSIRAWPWCFTVFQPKKFVFSSNSKIKESLLLLSSILEYKLESRRIGVRGWPLILLLIKIPSLHHNSNVFLFFRLNIVISGARNVHHLFANMQSLLGSESYYIQNYIVEGSLFLYLMREGARYVQGPGWSFYRGENYRTVFPKVALGEVFLVLKFK
jgi:hypothetical protein